MLKSIYLSLRKVKVQRVTVVEFGMYNRGGDGVGSLEVKVRGECSAVDECDCSHVVRSVGDGFRLSWCFSGCCYSFGVVLLLFILSYISLFIFNCVTVLGVFQYANKDLLYENNKNTPSSNDTIGYKYINLRSKADQLSLPHDTVKLKINEIKNA